MTVQSKCLRGYSVCLFTFIQHLNIQTDRPSLYNEVRCVDRVRGFLCHTDCRGKLSHKTSSVAGMTDE